MSLSSSERALLGDVLKRVSRSFYLTLAILPQAVRAQIGLAYLFARAADTIADTGALDDVVRVQCLQQLKQQFGNETPVWSDIQNILKQVIPQLTNPDERRLLEQLEQCFHMYLRLSHVDQSEIAQVVSVLIGGMEFDLQQFPKNHEQTVHALADVQDFEYYTYAVAGCVGEFWTKMICAHLPRMEHWEETTMVPIGIRYGKGLQMVNILRDIPQDLRNGRCYIPQVLLQEYNLSPEQLLDPSAAKTFRPLFRRLIHEARDHLDQGWLYTMAIPRMEVRLRLACMWPLLIGIRTLQALSMTQHLLDPSQLVKITRRDIYGIVAATGLTGGCTTISTAYWGYWRKRMI